MIKRASAILLVAFWAATLILPVWAEESYSEEDKPLSQIAIEYDFEHRTLEEILAQFRAESNLSESNFSMSCYITGTKELISFAGDTFRVAASTYKLPLNMVYYDMERSGEISSDRYIDGYYLPTMHYETIVNSNNDMAISMLYNLGSFRQYREIMTQFYDQEYPSEYYSGNNTNSDYMLAVLWKLYCNAEDYPELLSNLKIAARGQYFQLYQGDYEIAHKYGYYEGAINDVGIIYTPEPVLVAAYTENVGYAESKLGHLAELLTEYSLYHTEKKAQEEAARLAEAQAAEEARLAEEQAAEEARLAEEQAAEEARLAEEQAAEEARLAEEQAAAEATEAREEVSEETVSPTQEISQVTSISTNTLLYLIFGFIALALIALIILVSLLIKRLRRR